MCVCVHVCVSSTQKRRDAHCDTASGFESIEFNELATSCASGGDGLQEGTCIPFLYPRTSWPLLLGTSESGERTILFKPGVIYEVDRKD